MSQARRRSFDQRKAPLAIAVLVAVVVLSAIGAMPIAGLALAGATLLVLMS